MSISQPNVLLIHWHDLGRHLGCYGAAGVTSPAVDGLAGQGLLLRNAFAAAPLCSPARGALFTGRYPHANGLMGLAHLGWEYGQGERTLAHLLADRGYATVLVGLQHETSAPERLGFQELLATDKPCRAADVAAAAGSALARSYARPFFMTVGFSEVHRPYPADSYPPDRPDEVAVPPFLPDNDWTRDDLAAFQGCIRVADDAVGAILAALAASEHADDTLVIFTTDHGMAFPRAKSTLYDAGTGVSLIMRLTGSQGGRTGVEDGMFSHVDLVPTLLEMLALPAAKNVQGVSQAQRLTTGNGCSRTDVFTEKTYHDCYDPIRGVRTTRWKYISNAEQRPALIFPVDIDTSATRYGYGSGGDRWLVHRPAEELYRLSDDPLERVNLAADPAYQQVRQELAERLAHWQHETGDPLLGGPIGAPPRPRLSRFGALEQDVPAGQAAGLARGEGVAR